MPIWTDPTKRAPYVLEAERARPPAEQTRFLFRVMRASDYADFADAVILGEGQVENYGRYLYLVLRNSLVGWEGAGVPAFEADADGHPTDETLSRIPHDDRWELARYADKVNTLQGADLKN